MKISKKDAKFVLRVLVLLVASLTLGLAIKVVFNSNEIEKLIAQSRSRDILLFAAPLTSLAILHYTLAVRSFGMRSILVELTTFSGLACILSSIISPVVIGSYTSIPSTNCRWYRSCPDEIIWTPNLVVTFTLAGIGIGLLIFILGHLEKPRHARDW